MALIENIQREDLNPLEEARGLRRLTEEFGMTHEAAARAVGRSRSATTNLLRLLNLSEPVQQMLLVGDLEMGHARALLALDGARQIIEANEIVARKLSVRDAERRVGRLAHSRICGGCPRRARKVRKGAISTASNNNCQTRLSAPVEVRVKKRTSRGEAGEIAIALRFARRAQWLARPTRPRAAVACAPRQPSNFAHASSNFSMAASTRNHFGTLLANLDASATSSAVNALHLGPSPGAR